MIEDLQNLEWCIFDIDHNDYFFSLDKETINKINDWEERVVVLHHSSSSDCLNDIQERMRKELVLWLLSNEERRKEMTDAVVKNHWREA